MVSLVFFPFTKFWPSTSVLNSGSYLNDYVFHNLMPVKTERSSYIFVPNMIQFSNLAARYSAHDYPHDSS